MENKMNLFIHIHNLMQFLLTNSYLKFSLSFYSKLVKKSIKIKNYILINYMTLFLKKIAGGKVIKDRNRLQLKLENSKKI